MEPLWKLWSDCPSCLARDLRVSWADVVLRPQSSQCDDPTKVPKLQSIDDREYLEHGEGLPRVGWMLVGEITLQQRPERVRVRWQVRREDVASGRLPYRRGGPRR
jgi:hypothetical protein